MTESRAGLPGQFYSEIQDGKFVNEGKFLGGGGDLSHSWEVLTPPELPETMVPDSWGQKGRERFSWKPVLYDLGAVAVGVLVSAPLTVLAVSALTHGIDYNSDSWRIPAAAMIVMVDTLGSMIASLEIKDRLIKRKPKLAVS